MPIHHLAVGTERVELVARFYGDVFGLLEKTRHLDEGGQLRSIWLELDPGVLMVERSGSPAPTPGPPGLGVGRGLFLLAFEASADQRATFEAEMARRGIELDGRTEHTSYARDPDGNRIAVSSYPLEPS